MEVSDSRRAELFSNGSQNISTKDVVVVLNPTDRKSETSSEITRKKRLRRQLDGLISGSTINGLAQAFSEEKRNYKIFWFVLFFLGVVGFVVNLYHITDNFAQRPILMQMEQSYTPFSWPHFTICNPSNPIPFWKSPELKEKWLKTMNTSIKNYTLPKYYVAGVENRPRKIWEHNIVMSSINPEEFYRHGLNGNIWRVSIVHRQSTISTSSGNFDGFHAVKSSKENYFYTTLDSVRAPIPCYTLAPEKFGNLTDHDQLLAIKLHILMDFQSYELFNPGYESRKLYVYLNHPNRTLQSATPHYVLAGTLNHFHMRQKTHKRVENCIDEEFMVEMYDISMTKSRQFIGDYDDCRMHLSQKIYVQECGCYNPNLPLYKLDANLPRLCTNMSLYDNATMVQNIECLNRLISNDMFGHKFKEKLFENCAIYLQPRCVTSRYIVDRNTHVWQDSDMSEIRRNRTRDAVRGFPNFVPNATESFVRQNLAVVVLSWNKETTEVIYEQFEYPTSQFVSDVGGIAGLWIGLSVISVFEILELLFVFCKTLRA